MSEAETGTPQGSVEASPTNMGSVLSEFASEPTVASDPVKDAVAELTEQQAEATPEATEAEQSEVEAPDDQTPAELEDEPQADAPEPDPSVRYTVKVDGEDRKVSLQELKAGYSRTEHYTAKTMALAEERKGLTQTLEADYSNKLKQATDLFVQLDPILAQADKIDWQALAREDPATYTQLKAEVEARQDAVGKAREEMQRLTTEAKRREQEANAEQAKAEAVALVKAMPELADNAKMSEFATNTVGYLRTTGFADPEILELLDHRALMLVDKARRWDAQEKARQSLPQRKVVQAPQAKPLKGDADAGLSTPRKAPASGASMDTKKAWVVQELLAQGR